ncbi:ABC transporter substrate-binding protein [Butyrivibrio sp. NC3005]|uniref:ABC transporter substrate-binding protein n=1 Tax=Butyrivibrio sp. NC3005 TaxID=1280685 RepID=UPI000403758E|nr:extracellular solute-binding protein [Butyrivibrio sp. NC3005]
MNKKVFASCVSVFLGIALLCSGCSSEKSSSSSNENSSGLAKGSLTIINSKSEVSSQIDELASAYSKTSGVEIKVVNIASSSVDVQATIKGMYLSDNSPDIIVCETSSFESWDGLLVDMSDQEWVTRTEYAYKDSTYGVIGFPYATEAIGFAYNADILKKAGVDPLSLTSPDAYKSAFEKIDSQKESLGITAVVGYYAGVDTLGWSTGGHIFGNYLDAGLARDDTTYIDLFNDGIQFDEKRINDFVAFIDLIQKYSDKDKILTGTYEEQVQNFASGKYAFVTQGSWIGASMSGEYSSDYQAAGNFEVGMAPYAFQNGIDTILTSPPAWWSIMKEGNVDAAKDFLLWCSKDEGQQILVEKAGFTSPFSDSKYVASDPFSKTVSSYIAKSKTSNWHWMNMREGTGNKALAIAFDDFAAGKVDRQGFIDEMRKLAKEHYEK